MYRRLAQAYALTYRQLVPEVNALLSTIREAIAAGKPLTRAWLVRQAQYKALLEQLEREIGRFSGVARSMLTAEQQTALRLGAEDAAAILARMEVSVAFGGFDPRAVEKMLAMLDNASPLQMSLERLAGRSVQAVKDSLITGLIRGKNPNAIASEIKRVLSPSPADAGAVLNSARAIARTEVMRAYREATGDVYRQNRDVLDGWVWLAELDETTCIVCTVMHGTIHSVDESLDSHPNCRCTQVPLLKGQASGIELGTEAFANYDEERQRSILGPGSYDLWKSGGAELTDFVRHGEDPRWGGYRERVPLKDLAA